MTNMHGWRVGLLVLSLAFITVACTKNSSSGTVPTAGGATAPSQGGSQFDLSGTWTGAWTDTTPDSSVGGFTLTLTQLGSNLRGAIVITGTACLSAGKVTGQLNGDQISFGAAKGDVTVDYTGAVTVSTMQGSFKTSCGAEGTWGAKKSA